MKKTIIILLALLSWQSVSADVVGFEEARRRAAEFFASVTTKDSQTQKAGQDGIQLVYSIPEVSTKSSSEDPALYVFERENGGYVVIAGEDAARPVLGYSLDGRFDVKDMPEALHDLLEWYSEVIVYARSQHWKAGPKRMADIAQEVTASSYVQLKTARWHQGDPFNRLVPEINGEKPPIGCVPTALAIVMRYYKHPARGKGTLPSYSYTKGGGNFTVPGHELQNEYDWDMMPDAYTLSYTEEEADQISKLMYDVAVMCQARFYPGGTSANAPNSARRLATYFGYNKDMEICVRSQGYTDEVWEQLVRNELDSGRPVYYSGADKAGSGHAFVVDGYRGKYFFTINFGWGGKASAYYTLTPVAGYEEQLITFYRNNHMACRLTPTEPGAPNLYSEGINFVPSDFSVGKTFPMTGTVRNRSSFPISLELNYVLYNIKGLVKEVVSAGQQVDFPAGGAAALSFPECCLTTPVVDGDAIVLSFLDPDTGEWTPVPQPRSSRIVFTTAPIQTKLLLECNPTLERDLCIKLYKDMTWELLREDGSSVFGDMNINQEKIGTGYSLVYTMMDNYDPKSETVRCRFRLDSGTYFLHITNPANGEEMTVKLVI